MTQQLGAFGENKVSEFLQKYGFSILARNYAVRGGEIDIIAQKDDVVVFVEVKTRTHHTFALSEVITPSKQRKIISTAKHFICVKKLRDKLFRFDVALVEGHNAEIKYLRNAFSETGSF